VLGSACTPGPQGGTSGSATGGTPTAASSSPAPETARDGRTVLPTGESVACGLLGDDAIKSSLGTVAKSLQPAQPDAERTAEGVLFDSCIHAFEPDGATTNALTVQIITYPTEQEASRSNPYGLLPAPEDVPGLKNETKYSLIPLSGSKEFVIVSLDGARIVKLIVALTPDAAWEPAAGRETMFELARTAQL
jgi:hypothetical protein